MKKRVRILFLMVLTIVLFVGCGKERHTTDPISATEQIKETESVKETEPVKETEQIDTANGVDMDLTVMGSDMVYATVYQLMVDPDTYVGKTIRMEGTYYAAYYEPTEKYYHYCIIADATVCCTQGMEFVWDDGSHVYPDEYPAEETEIIVTGVFETYREEGDPNLYCRLKDAVMERKE